MNKSFLWSARAFLAAGLLISTPAFAQEDAAEAAVVEAEEVEQQLEAELEAGLNEAGVTGDVVDLSVANAKESDKNWSLSAGLRSSVSQGTFASVANDTEWKDVVKAPDNSYDRVSMSLSLGAGYQLDEFDFGIGFGMSQYLTEGGGSGTVQEFRISDVSLSAGWSGHTFESTGIRIAPSLSVGLPASTSSRYSSLLFDTSLGIGISKRFFNKVTLSYSLSGTTFFHRYTTPIVSIEKIGRENALYRAEELVSSTHFAVGGRNSQYSLGNSFSIRVPLWSKLSMGVSYGLFTHWSYAGDNDDDLASDNACIGRCSGQSSSGSVSFNYGVNDWLSVNAGLNSRQAPKTSDNKSFRFPFWNFTGAGANMSSFSLGISAVY